MALFHGVNMEAQLNIKGSRGYGVSAAVACGDEVDTYCTGSGRFGRDFPVNPDMLFQAGSVSKPMFALTLLRYADQGIIDLEADLSGVLSDLVDSPLTFPALLSHTAGFNVGGFPGYRARHKPLTLEVRIVKMYDGEETSAFVNGILGAYARSLDAEVTQ